MLKGSSSGLGYRSMQEKLRRLGYITNKETVRLCLKNLDGSHVALRKCRRLQRLQYISPGPAVVCTLYFLPWLFFQLAI